MENLSANSFKKMYRDHKTPHSGNVYWCMCEVWRYALRDIQEVGNSTNKKRKRNNPLLTCTDSRILSSYIYSMSNNIHIGLASKRKWEHWKHHCLAPFSCVSCLNLTLLWKLDVLFSPTARGRRMETATSCVISCMSPLIFFLIFLSNLSANVQ